MFKLGLVLKGFAIGSANVIPGVSGGTIAVITGVYERLIEALKRFDGTTVRFLLRLNLRGAWERVDGRFLFGIGIGVIVSVATMARVMEWGFENHPVLVWAFFFGLIVASIPSLGARIERWTLGPVVGSVAGLGAGGAVAFLQPASGSDNMIYLGLCGAVSVCSMIIPGLSGSFILLLMGGYRLVMVEAINGFTGGEVGKALNILIPFLIGGVAGLVLLSRLLSWLFRRAHDLMMALITGFVGGSLVVIWPWKITITKTFIRDGEETEKIAGFTGWFLPDMGSQSTWIALGCMLAGSALVTVGARFSSSSGAS